MREGRAYTKVKNKVAMVLKAMYMYSVCLAVIWNEKVQLTKKETSCIEHNKSSTRDCSLCNIWNQNL